MRGRTPIDPADLVLSVLVPVYNERATVAEIVRQRLRERGVLPPERLHIPLELPHQPGHLRQLPLLGGRQRAAVETDQAGHEAHADRADADQQ